MGPACKALMHTDEAGAKQIDVGLGPNWDQLIKIIQHKHEAGEIGGDKEVGKGKGKGKHKGKRKQS